MFGQNGCSIIDFKMLKSTLVTTHVIQNISSYELEDDIPNMKASMKNITLRNVLIFLPVIRNAYMNTSSSSSSSSSSIVTADVVTINDESVEDFRSQCQFVIGFIEVLSDSFTSMLPRHLFVEEIVFILNNLPQVCVCVCVCLFVGWGVTMPTFSSSFMCVCVCVCVCVT
jgi:hypothetical protein